MHSKKRKWLIAFGVLIAVAAVVLGITISVLSKRYEPYIRDQAVRYLRDRFDSEVELDALHIRMPRLSTLGLLITHGRGSVAEVEGTNLTMRHMGRRDLPPMFAIRHFQFDVDLALLFAADKRVPLVRLDGMEIYVPPKGDRPKFGSHEPSGPPAPAAESGSRGNGVVIEDVMITNATLVILPRDESKIPLSFDISNLHLQSAGKNVAMTYDAQLTNPKPPGIIHSRGTFGPWAAERPSDTPLAGDYTFDQADLSVFHGIAGILSSQGHFEGDLDTIDARGQAVVPDFRLKSAGNPVPLRTSFEVQVDGTNGDTILKPVVATLGNTRFTTSGAVIKREKHGRRTISLDVKMPDGYLKDVLGLAMNGSPFMGGRISMNTKIGIPPLSGAVKEKLLLDGRFEISDGEFLKSRIQDQIDSLSRRGQGKPGNQEIDEVISGMDGAFKLEDQVITFSSLAFAIPGASVNLAGSYDLGADQLDFHGALGLQAKVSQTMTGWKRWALKPVDPIFAKNGKGTFLHIKVDGTAKDPKFGLDRGGKKDENTASEKNGPTRTNARAIQ